MPTFILRRPRSRTRRATGHGGKPPVTRRPTGGGGGGGDDSWRNLPPGAHKRLGRIRLMEMCLLGVDMLFFVLLVAIYFARQTGSHLDPRTHLLMGDWRGLTLPPILFLNTALLLLSCLTMERARRNIFHEIDVMEEWLGLGRPALARTLPWLGATFVLGGLFLAGQATSWRQLSEQGFPFAHATPAVEFFYLITGLHALHLLAGVSALAFCLTCLHSLKRVELRQIAVDVTAWFWHAMCLIWMLLVAVLALGQ